MKMPVSVLILMAIVLGAGLGCSHRKPRQESPAFQVGLAQAVAEMQAQVLRAPAQNTGIHLQQFSKLSPAKFKVFVFPKLRQLSAKSRMEDKEIFKNAKDENASLLGSPGEFEVSVLAENPCRQFIRGGLFKNLNPASFFDPALAEDGNRRCAILEVTSMAIKNANKALIRRDDLLRMRLYLDDTYTLHGSALEKHVNGQQTRIVNVKSTEAISAASGMTLFPVDLPRMVLLQAQQERASLQVQDKIDGIALGQIRRKFKRNYQPSKCPGTKLSYRDSFGAPVEVGWCDGLPFPMLMENARFLAITEALSVRE